MCPFCKASTYLPSSSSNVFAEITSLLDILFQRFYLDTTGIYNTKQLQPKPSPVMMVQLFFSVCCSTCPPSTISQVETALLSCRNKETCYSHQPASAGIAGAGCSPFSAPCDVPDGSQWACRYFFFLSTPTQMSRSKAINQVRKRGGDTISQECPRYQCSLVVKQAQTILHS